MPDIKEFNSVRETAEILGVHYQTIRLWIKKGFLASSKPTGGKIYISAESINAMLNNGKKEDADGR
jgi:excisionase family DNA binding protein